MPKRFSVLLIALALVALGASSVSGQTQPTVAVAPNTGLVDAQSVVVTGSGFTPLTFDIGVAQCTAASIGTLPGDCIGHLVTPANNGSFSTSFTVRRFIGSVDCASAAGTCVIGASNLQGPNGAFSDQAFAPLTFASSQDCAGLPATIVGTSGDDTLTGTSRNDVISGGGGNDTIRGGAGADRVCGGDGNDVVYGGSGNDVVSGGAANDTLAGDSGSDALDGGTETGPPADSCDGGSGPDTSVNCETVSTVP